MLLHTLPLVFLLANFFRVDAGGGFDNPTSDLDQYQNIPATEFNALEDLYTATNGQNWTWSSNVSTVHWNFTDIGTNPCTYQWQGLTCRYTQTANNTITCNIEEIYLSSYNLNGTIPESIGNFPFLTQLELAQNIGLHSTIPYTIGQLRNLSILDLSSNNFTGSIPESLGLLTTLTSLNLGNNRLTGPIPLSFGNLTSLEALQLPSNWLSGSIPPTLANLQGSLKALNLYINDLTGPFPNFLCNFTQMEYIGLSVNLITGTLSEEVSKLTNLQELYFDKTLVSGTLPPSLFQLSQMLNFDVSHDTFLTGTLPAEVGNWANAQGFYVNTCSFTGTLPASLGNMSQLDYLFTEDNLFTGTLPAALGNLSRVTFFDVYHNLLTGTIPDSYGHLSSVNYLYLGGQMLEGSVPASLFQLSNLLSFQLQNSLFSGSLPSDITALRSLNTFDITSNRFSGPLPVGLGNLPYVQYLFLSNNRLSGQLDTIANSSVQTQLVTIDISNNQFTGSIPVEPFKVAGFQSFAAIVNCMTGEIPAEICQCTSLLFLELDGMCTAQKCRNKNYHLLPSQFSSYSLSENQQVTGSIPACLFNMENLIALHLSGNGIQGSILLQTNSSIAASLQDLSLSHNLLTGDIPPSLLQRGWAANLDLSYNKLTGILPSDATSGPDSGGLSLEVNRLSGRIPDSFLSAPQISILDGNIFECDDSKANTLPTHDKNAGTYNCGSNSFNQSVYSWIAIFGTVVALCVAVYFSTSCDHLCSPAVSAFITRNKGLVVQWWAAYNSEVCVSKSMGEFHLIQVTIRRYCVAIAALAIAVLLPVYAALTYFFNSYEYEYAWTVSTAFLSGEPAGIVLFVLFGAIVTVLTARCLRANQVRAGEITDTSHKNKRKSAVESTTTPVSPIAKETAQVGTQGRARGRTESWATTGASAVDRETLVRASFVSTVHQTVHQTVEQTVHLTAAAVSQSIELVRAQDYAQLRRLLGVLVINTMVVVVVNAAYVYTKLNFSATTIFVEQVLLALFKIFWNEIVVAYMLFYAVRSSGEHQNDNSGIGGSSGSSDNDHIYIQLSMTLFSVLVVPCLVTLAVSSDCFFNYFVAPDAVAVSYAYVYCQYYHTAIKDGVTVTSCNDNALVTVESSYNPPFLYSFQCSSNLITNYANIYVYMFVIVAVVEPVYQQLFRYTMAASVRNNQKTLVALHKRLLSRLLRPVEANSAAGSGDNNGGGNGLEGKQSNVDPGKNTTNNSSGALVPRRSVFKKDKYIVRVVTYLCLLLTFGVAFPPLAVVITTAVLSYTYLLQVYLGRFMQQQSREAICRDVWGVGWDLFRCVWLVVPLVSCFFSFFVFDTLGDTLGWQRAMVWALVLACLPACMVLCYFSGKVLTARVLKSKGSSNGSSGGDVEEQEERKERMTEMMPAVRHVEASTETVSPLSSHSDVLHIEGQSSKVVHTDAHDNV